MEQIVFGEIKKEEEKIKDTSSRSPIGTFSFMTLFSSIKEVTNVNDITVQVNNNSFKLSSPYTIFYLYDIRNDAESRNMITTYGGTLSNKSSLTSIITYFTKGMLDRWNNVQFKDMISSSMIDSSIADAELAMDRIKNDYKVKSFPAIVVAKNDSENDYAVISLNGCDCDSIYKIFDKVLEAVNNNYNTDFSELARELGCDKAEKKRKINKLSFSDYISDLVKSKDNYNLDQFAQDLGYSTKQIYNKRQNCSFSRDELIQIAYIFDLSIEELNSMLEVNEQRQMGISGKDGVFYRGLLNNKEYFEVLKEVRERNIE